MHLLADTAAQPTTLTWIFLALALTLALGFEFVNGFHDTANAVATVIYTNSLPPTIAVIWSGLFNLLGVIFSGGLVAYTIVGLLPTELVLNIGSGSGFAMVFALLVSAIIWNLGTWYLALPASSSHTLIGSIIGVGVANAIATGHPATAGVNWEQVEKVGLALLVSPVLGFVWAGVLLLLLKFLVRIPALYAEPEKGKAPPWWIRGILISTCTGVSYFHGSNDGQKGMGLIVLILVGILPGMYALKMDESPERIHALVVEAQAVRANLEKKSGEAKMAPEMAAAELSVYVKYTGTLRDETWPALVVGCQAIETKLGAVKTFDDLSDSDRRAVRKDLYLVANTIAKLNKGKKIADPDEAATAAKLQKDLDGVTKYIPPWVTYAVALALGLGTTVGWKRIVVTVGEKIGKTHLSYAQGACAELIAMLTIALADTRGWPVSTTHVLSSGVAGTMTANKSGLQLETLRNLLLAWVLTLPVCIVLGSLLFAFGNYIILNVLGLN